MVLDRVKKVGMIGSWFDIVCVVTTTLPLKHTHVHGLKKNFFLSHSNFFANFSLTEVGNWQMKSECWGDFSERREKPISIIFEQTFFASACDCHSEGNPIKEM